LRSNRKVCFEFDTMVKLVTEGDVCRWGMKYESVIGFGTASIVTDPDERKRGLRAVVEQYGGRGSEFDEAMLARTAILRVDIESLSDAPEVLAEKFAEIFGVPLPSATVDAWATYYANLTGVTFVVSEDVQGMPAEDTTLTDFQLSERSVAAALKIIQARTGVAYRVRNGDISQLTRDHSLLEDYKEAKPDMTEEEERNFPHKNVITRALGMRDTVQVDIQTDEVQDGDLFLLCSDGLSTMVPDEQIREVLLNSEDLEKSVAELVDMANRAGGTDNITTLVLKCSNTAGKGDNNN